MNDERSELMLLYVAGQADPEERARVERWLASGDPAAAAALAEARAIVGLLPEALDPIEPSPELWKKIEAGLASDAGAPRPHDSADRARAPTEPARPRWTLAVAAALVLSLLGGWIGYTIASNRHRPSIDELSSLRAEVAEQRRQIARLSADLELATQRADDTFVSLQAARDSLALLTDPTLRTVQLAGTPEMPDAVARVMFEPRRGVLHLSAADLRALDEGKTYELWSPPDEPPPIPLGTFDPETDGRATYRTTILDPGARITAIAISIEPAGGVPAPTGPIVLVGEVSQ